MGALHRLWLAICDSTGTLAKIVWAISVMLPQYLASASAQHLQQRIGIDRLVGLMTGGEPAVIQIPGVWAFAISIGLAMAFIIWSLAKAAWEYEKQLTPRVSAAFAPGGGGLVSTPEKEKNRLTGEVIREWQSIFVRVGVKSYGKKTAENCVAFLIRAERQNHSGRTQRVFDLDSIPIPWAHAKGSYEVTIPYRVKRFADVLKFSSICATPVFPYEYPLTLRGFLDC